VDDSRVNIFVRAGGQAADEPSSPPAAAAGAASVQFDRGGMGLELVLAEHVLATHGATVSPTPGGLVIHLRRTLRP
jgi:hypothetical protein